MSRPIPAGHPQPSPDTNARRSGGTRKDRCAVCTKRPMAGAPPLLKSAKGKWRYAQPRKPACWGRLRRQGAAGRRTPKAETPMRGEPHRAGCASARLRCGTGARKDDNGPTDAEPETFVQAEGRFRVPRSGVSCPPRRWRCGASQGHGMAAAMLAWDGAVPGPQDRHGGPPRRWLSWSGASASRTNGYRRKHPHLCTKHLIFAILSPYKGTLA